MALCLFLADTGFYGRKIIARHQFGNRLHGVFGKTHIAIGQDADKLAARLYYRNSRNAIFGHQRLRLGKRCCGRNRDRIDDHARFIALHLTDSGHLFFDRKVAVEHTNTAQLRHDDRHARFGNGVHSRRHDRDIECDAAGDPRLRVRLTGQNIRFTRLQQHVVKGQSKADFIGFHGATSL